MKPRRRSRGLAAAFAALLVAAATLSQPVQEGTRWLGNPRRAAMEPALCADGTGLLWVTWVSAGPSVRALPGPARVEGVALRDGEVVHSFTFDDAGDAPAAPSLTAIWEEGPGVHAVWEAERDGERVLLGRTLSARSDPAVVSELEVVPSAPGATGPPLEPALASTSGENGASVTLVFRALVGDAYDLFTATRTRDGWSTPRPLTRTPYDEWTPRVAAAHGVAHVTWDAFDGSSFDAWHARIDGESITTQAIATGPDYQGLPDVAVEPDGDAWITWERAPSFGEAGGLRASRRLGLARVPADAEEPVEFAAERELGRKNARRELPRVAAGEDGVALFFRAPQRADRKRDHLFTAWASDVLRFGENGGTATLETTDGGGDADLDAVVAGGDLWVAFAADRRSSRFGAVSGWSDAIERTPRIGLVKLAAPTGAPKLEADPLPTLRTLPPAAPPVRSPRGVFFGDLHRHTHLSRCGGAKDGSALDVWRYARGPGALDFVAITDHYQHMRPWSFWRSLRDTERHHAPGSLVTFAAVERVRSKRGHYNDIYLDPRSVRYDVDAWNAAPSSVAPAPEDEVVSIPHMMSVDDGTAFDWGEFREDRTRVFEIYQGKRGSYEGRGLPFEAADGVEPETALARGFERGAHFGLVAASDHVSSATSYAGVHAAESSRASLFAALRARRAFAATQRTGVDARAGGLVMGERGTSDARTLSVEIPAERELAYVELVEDGRTVARVSGDDESVETWIVTLRRGQVLPASGLVVEVDGGRIVSARSRREAAGVVVESTESSARFARMDYVQADLALEIEWSGEGGALRLSARDDQLVVDRRELAPGRARALDETSFGGSIWRQGSPLRTAEGGAVTFDLDRRGGASYYARIAWTDGNLAWTSPITTRAAEEDE